MNVDLTVIIPTYNRPDDLETVLNSIMAQTERPKEVLIVDDSSNELIENLCKKMSDNLHEKNINLLYIRNNRERSSAIARNIGIEHCTGNIVMFLDDDVILEKEYIKQILKVYKEKPNALGVQGIIPSLAVKRKRNIMNKLCFSFHTEKGKCRVLPSTHNTYPYLVDEVIQCQWLSGANKSYKREVLQRFKFDENLKKYAFKEDIDLSYRIFKQYPDSLYMTPYAKLIHNESNAGRIPNQELIYVQQVYTFYIFYKNIDQTLMNKLIFYWSVAALLIRPSIGLLKSLVLGPSKSKIEGLKYLFASRVLCLRHLEEIKKGNLDFFNRILY
ncbi:glycosyltransferase family 2 protein [Candidatus Pacearchaeota archaeon]|nr:glycosyltransferase family 2 protein [Candidatus Pacearchaeota archaeon]